MAALLVLEEVVEPRETLLVSLTGRKMAVVEFWAMYLAEMTLPALFID
jgi:hypothetical protein